MAQTSIIETSYTDVLNPDDGVVVSSTKRAVKKTALLHIVFDYYYCNLKMIGTVKEQRTALPRCLPGFQLGML